MGYKTVLVEHRGQGGEGHHESPRQEERHESAAGDGHGAGAGRPALRRRRRGGGSHRRRQLVLRRHGPQGVLLRAEGQEAEGVRPYLSPAAGMARPHAALLSQADHRDGQRLSASAARSPTSSVATWRSPRTRRSSVCRRSTSGCFPDGHVSKTLGQPVPAARRSAVRHDRAAGSTARRRPKSAS